MAAHLIPADDDYYGILEVCEYASKPVISAAYTALHIIRHPNFNPENVNAEKSFQLLQTAYNTLMDDEKRKEYDQNTYPGVYARRQVARKAKTAIEKYTLSKDSPSQEQEQQNDEAQETNPEPTPKQNPTLPKDDSPPSQKSPPQGEEPSKSSSELEKRPVYNDVMQRLADLMNGLVSTVEKVEKARGALLGLPMGYYITAATDQSQVGSNRHTLTVTEARRRLNHSIALEKTRLDYTADLNKLVKEEAALQKEYAEYYSKHEAFLMQSQFYTNIKNNKAGNNQAAGTIQAAGANEEQAAQSYGGKLFSFKDASSGSGTGLLGGPQRRSLLSGSGDCTGNGLTAQGSFSTGPLYSFKN